MCRRCYPGLKITLTCCCYLLCEGQWEGLHLHLRRPGAPKGREVHYTQQAQHRNRQVLHEDQRLRNGDHHLPLEVQQTPLEDQHSRKGHLEESCPSTEARSCEWSPNVVVDDDLPFSLTSFFPHQRASLLSSKTASETTN